MKKNLLLVLAAAALLTACDDSADVRNIRGGYHYKTSGTVSVQPRNENPYTYNLTAETGQLEVVSLHDDDEVLITMNQTNGGVMTTKGRATDKRIDFDPFDRTVTIRTEVVEYDTIKLLAGTYFERDTIIEIAGHEQETFNLRVTGYAEVYDNNLVFNLTYQGQSQTTNTTLTGSDIKMLAKKN